MDNVHDDGGPSAVNSATLCVLLMPLLFVFACTKPMKKAVKATLPSTDTLVAVDSVRYPVVKKKSKKKKLYITFDDGPNKGTKNVLDIVKDEEIPVSFFVVGEHVFASRYQSEMWDSMQIMKHIEICNHSFSHAHHKYDKYYQQPDSVVKDFVKTKDTLQLANNIARTPGRNIWRIDSLQYTDIKKSAAAADSLQKAGFIVMGWDVEWEYDHKTMSVKTEGEKMVEMIDSAFAKNKTKQADHLVLLAHDQVYAKADDSIQLRKFLQKLKQNDSYEISLVSNYPRPNRDSFKIKTSPY